MFIDDGDDDSETLTLLVCSGLKFNSILRGLVAFELSVRARKRTSCLAELVWIFMVSAAECVILHKFGLLFLPAISKTLG